MWQVRNSIRRYREDPEWHNYRKKESAEWIRQFGIPGHPFGTFRNHALHVLEGQVRGYPATLFHLAGVRKGGRYGTISNRYSVAALTIPVSLPATSVSVGTLIYRLRSESLPPRAGASIHLPAGSKPRMSKCSVDPAFAELAITARVVHMTADAKIGWRLHGNHMIGWIKEMKPYEKIIALAETMADIFAEFPPSSPAWERSDRRPA
ncbi:hypothetical protein SAMN05428945_3410 [Streptomyces sp. 2224.1]|uniref:hypothetical protein n=1 Tax=Streptomyces sp. 2224.1 TaxID=1881020 RepID=UPI0008983C3B|nr:hypothetical protein [Streptomyces sp. 2224.1]SEC62507.1 hypothetical protein SAMN05428945_3410 [Streptomyces sp. 2224.1]